MKSFLREQRTQIYYKVFVFFRRFRQAEIIYIKSVYNISQFMPCSGIPKQFVLLVFDTNDSADMRDFCQTPQMGVGWRNMKPSNGREIKFLQTLMQSRFLMSARPVYEELAVMLPSSFCRLKNIDNGI